MLALTGIGIRIYRKALSTKYNLQCPCVNFNLCFCSLCDRPRILTVLLWIFIFHIWMIWMYASTQMHHICKIQIFLNFHPCFYQFSYMEENIYFWNVLQETGGMRTEVVWEEVLTFPGFLNLSICQSSLLTTLLNKISKCWLQN